jgi:hypothetical protein
MSYEPQTWSPMGGKKLHIIYVVYIDFIQSSSSNRWIEINLDLKWNLSSKMLLFTFQGFLLMYRIVKWCHQNLNLLYTMILVIH